MLLTQEQFQVITPVPVGLMKKESLQSIAELSSLKAKITSLREELKNCRDDGQKKRLTNELGLAELDFALRRAGTPSTVPLPRDWE